MAERLISKDKSVIVAADVDSFKLESILGEIADIRGIGAYKIGFRLGLLQGLPNVVAQINDKSNARTIYDHQKAGTDIPATGKDFAEVCELAKVDAAILFPHAGPETARAWIKALQDKHIGVLVGLHMTHDKFLVSEGGFIANDSPKRMFELAVSEGVRDFVVPGNKVEFVEAYRNLLERLIGPDGFTLYAPGFITQKGEVSEFAKVAGNRWHAIVGSGIYNAENMRDAALKMTSQLGYNSSI